MNSSIGSIVFQVHEPSEEGLFSGSKKETSSGLKQITQTKLKRAKKMNEQINCIQQFPKPTNEPVQ